MSEEPEKKQYGKYYIQTVIGMYFETKEKRDNYIKDHVEELSDDDKTKLLNRETVENSNDEEEITMEINVKEVKD